MFGIAFWALPKIKDCGVFLVGSRQLGKLDDDRGGQRLKYLRSIYPRIDFTGDGFSSNPTREGSYCNLPGLT